MTASTGEERERERTGSEKRRGRIPADTFANRLMLTRAIAGHLSIREAAELCGYGRGAWTNWERGARALDILEVAQTVAEKLDVDEEWLLFGGPLTPARGRPVRDTREYRLRMLAEVRHGDNRPPDNRPNGRASGRGEGHPGGSRSRRPRIVIPPTPSLSRHSQDATDIRLTSSTLPPRASRKQQ